VLMRQVILFYTYKKSKTVQAMTATAVGGIALGCGLLIFGAMVSRHSFAAQFDIAA